MAGTINSLGIGSGVLTSDIIDQLKENEKTYRVKPLEKKIELEKQKKEVLDMFKSLVTTLKGSTSALAEDTIFAKRTVEGNNNDVEVSANDGVDPQTLDISDISLAKASVQQSGTFASDSAVIASGAGTLYLTVGDSSYSFDYTRKTGLDDLRDAINDKAGDDVTASIIQINDNEYSLVVKSDNTGLDQTITLVDPSGNLDTKLTNRTLVSDSFSSKSSLITNSGGSGTMTIDVGGVSSSISYDGTTSLNALKASINSDPTLKDIVRASIIEDQSAGGYRLVLNPIGTKDGADITITDSSGGDLSSKLLKGPSDMKAGSVTEVQKAKNATFKLNGIALERASNTINDAISGVTIKLLKESGSATINIKQDTSAIADELQNFVDAYNSMIDQLDKMTLADKEKQTVGVFSGDSSIRNIGREITSILMETDSDSGYSLMQFGIDLDKNGKLTFKSSEFNDKFNEDPKKAQLFFAGKSEFDKYDNLVVTDGIFDKLDNQINSYTKYNGLFDILSNSIEKEQKSLQNNYDSTLKLLNKRYDTLTQQFVEYDAVISKMNQQANSLLQQIQMAINSK